MKKIYNYLLYIFTVNCMQVAKWGNSLSVRLPSALVQQLGIAEGDQLQVVPSVRPGVGAVIAVRRTPSKLERLQVMRKHRGILGADFCFDREEANAR